MDRTNQSNIMSDLRQSEWNAKALQRNFINGVAASKYATDSEEGLRSHANGRLMRDALRTKSLPRLERGVKQGLDSIYE